FSVNLVEFPESVHVRVGNHLPYFIIIFIAHRCRSYPPYTGLKLFLIQIHCIIRSVLYNVYSELRVLIFKVTFKTSKCRFIYLYLLLIFVLPLILILNFTDFIKSSLEYLHIIECFKIHRHILNWFAILIEKPYIHHYHPSVLLIHFVIFFCIPLTAFVIFKYINNFFIKTLSTSRKINLTIFLTYINLTS